MNQAEKARLRPCNHPHQALLQAGLNLLDQGITVFDADLCLVSWNDAFLRLLDFPKELAYVGAPFESFIRYNAQRGEYGSEDVEQLVSERVSAARAFQAHYVERQRPGGQIIAVRGGPLPHSGFVALYTDITAQRRYEKIGQEQSAELEKRVRERTEELQASNRQLIAAGESMHKVTAALRRSEERLSLITDSVPALIGYFDKNLIYRYVNQRYAAWFGRNKSEVAGHQLREVIGDAIYQEVLPYIRRGLEGHQVTYQYSMEMEGGRVVHARSMLVPEFDPDGSVLGCFVLSVDISELKATQAALAQAQKMEAVGQLTGGIAHDFNNLLTVVIGNLTGLLEKHPRDEVAEFVDPALRVANRGAEMIKRLLAFSRQQPLELRPVDTAELVRGAITLLRRSLPENIHVSAQSAAPALFALTDPNQLENALINLAFNARDAMPGGGKLQIDIAALDVTDEFQLEFDVSPGRYVQISVVDTGEGMSPSVVARAFEPFFTTKRFNAGNGLGLSMAHGFAKQSGGGARIHSVLAQGTTVHMLFPRFSMESIRPVSDVDVPETSVPVKPLVLLVDDDADVRKVVRQQLTDLGYPVLEVEDGAEAVIMLQSVPDIGILVSDIVMPGSMNGREIGSMVRQKYPHIQVILISGYADDVQMEKASEGALFVL